MKNREFPKAYFGENPSIRLSTSEELDRNLAKFKRTLVLFIKGLPQGARVLDAGCGKGKASRIIMAYRPDITVSGVDISDVKDFLPEGVEFKTGGVEDVAEMFPENHFDAIICQHVFEHLLYPMGAMVAFKKVLRNKGKIYLETPNWARAIIPVSQTFFWNDYTHIRIFTVAAMRRLFGDFNFEIIDVKTLASAGFFMSDDSISKVRGVYREKDKNIWKFLKQIILVAVLRLLNPFIKDILIVVAINKK